MSSTKPLNLGYGVTYRPQDTHGYPGGGLVVFSNDLGQLRVGSVSVKWLCVNLNLLLTLKIYNTWECVTVRFRIETHRHGRALVF